MDADKTERFTEFGEGLRLPPGGNGYGDRFTEIKRLEGPALSGIRRLEQIGFQSADELGPQIVQGGILPDVQRRKALGQARLVAGGQGPLGKIVGETFGKEVMLLQALKGVVEDGVVRAEPDAVQKLRQGNGALTGDAGQHGRGHETKWSLGDFHLTIIHNCKRNLHT